MKPIKTLALISALFITSCSTNNNYHYPFQASANDAGGLQLAALYTSLAFLNASANHHNAQTCKDIKNEAQRRRCHDQVSAIKRSIANAQKNTMAQTKKEP